MAYEIGYSPYKVGRLCSRSSACVEGGKILKRQLQFTAQAAGSNNWMARDWCHLACVESSQKMNVRREHPSGEGFLGYDSLVPEDKARVSEVFGWAKASVDGLQPNSAPTKISPVVTVPNGQSEGSLPKIAPEPTPLRAWGAKPVFDAQAMREALKPRNKPTFSDSQTQGQLGQSNKKELSSLYDQLSPVSQAPARSVDGVGVLHNQERAPSGQTRAKNDMLIKQLELEEKEARVSLANAELEVVKSKAKLQAARHAFIEQKLKMVRASRLHGDVVISVT